MLRRRSRSPEPEPSVTLADVATGGHVRYGTGCPALDVEPDDRVSILAEQRARSRLFFDEMLGGRWSLPDVWDDQ